MGNERFSQKIQGVFYEESTITLGTGSTKKTQSVKNFCQAEEASAGNIKISYMDNEGKLTGIILEMPHAEFLKKYTLEPSYRIKTKEEIERDKHIAIAEKHREHSEPNSAELEYIKALKIDPESVRANFGIGTLYMEMGEVDKAKYIFRKISQIDALFEEENKHLFNEFGIELRKADMAEEALANYLKAITISPQDEHLYFNVTRLYFEKKDWNTALEWLKKAFEINPEFKEAKSLETLIFNQMKG
jgi:tetratricopeptide (TPR) repeat protein